MVIEMLKQIFMFIVLLFVLSSCSKPKKIVSEQEMKDVISRDFGFNESGEVDRFNKIRLSFVVSNEDILWLLKIANNKNIGDAARRLRQKEISVIITSHVIPKESSAAVFDFAKQILSYGDVYVESEGVSMLKMLNMPEAIPVLEKYYSGCKDKDVAEKVRVVIKSIKQKNGIEM